MYNTKTYYRFDILRAYANYMWTLSSCVPIKRDELLIIFASASPFYLLHFFFYKISCAYVHDKPKYESQICACFFCLARAPYAIPIPHTHALSCSLSGGVLYQIVPLCVRRCRQYSSHFTSARARVYKHFDANDDDDDARWWRPRRLYASALANEDFRLINLLFIANVVLDEL